MRGLAWSYGTELTIAGSPASVVSDNNVFGTLCVVEGFRMMVHFFQHHMGVALPLNPSLWTCSRIDVTQNYDLGGQIAVAQALDYLRFATTRGNNTERKHSTVYWNKSSSMRAGKAYNKFLHAINLTKKNQAHYTPQELKACENILRLELKLGRKWFHKQTKQWHHFTPQDLLNEHHDFFRHLANEIEVPTMDSLLDKLISVAPTEAQAKSAFSYYCTIMNLGSEVARQTTTKSTHYRHVKNLKLAGLTSADLRSGQILSFRPRVITMNPVNSWSEIKVA